MSYTEKMDVLDFIIEALKEHEKALDEISYKLGCCLGDENVDKISTLKGFSPQEKLNNWR
jgi:hypothetical protein